MSSREARWKEEKRHLDRKHLFLLHASTGYDTNNVDIILVMGATLVMLGKIMVKIFVMIVLMIRESDSDGCW